MESIEFKRQAAERAVEFIESGMVIGLGHGTTATFALQALAGRLRAGTLRDIVGIPCSRQIEQLAIELGVPLTTFAAHPCIDITIDGADEIDPHLDVIKGGGGALLREKIVAQATRREIIVAADAKLSPMLGTIFAVPIEVVPFGWEGQVRFLASIGGTATLRMAGDEPAKTDQGNMLLDCAFGAIADTHALAAQLQARAGIVEHGLFLDIASDAIIAGPGGIQHLRRML